jgi:farnesyl diphosphate synthase
MRSIRFLPAATTVPPAKLHEAMRYTVLGGGKRVRPLLVYAAGALFGADEENAMPGARRLRVEMIHAYSLVHDDMPCMDDDACAAASRPCTSPTTKRPRCWSATRCRRRPSRCWPARRPVPPARLVAMLRLLAAAAGSAGMCGGQAIDLDSVGLSLTLEQLERMHQLKTGAMLRARCCWAPWPARISRRTNWKRCGLSRAIGLAFQVVDDVLDATADSATLGKTAGKDAADNKPTYVSILGLEPSKALAEQLRRQAHERWRRSENKHCGCANSRT